MFKVNSLFLSFLVQLSRSILTLRSKSDYEVVSQSLTKAAFMNEMHKISVCLLYYALMKKEVMMSELQTFSQYSQDQSLFNEIEHISSQTVHMLQFSSSLLQFVQEHSAECLDCLSKLLKFDTENLDVSSQYLIHNWYSQEFDSLIQLDYWTCSSFFLTTSERLCQIWLTQNWCWYLCLFQF